MRWPSRKGRRRGICLWQAEGMKKKEMRPLLWSLTKDQQREQGKREGNVAVEKPSSMETENSGWNKRDEGLKKATGRQPMGRSGRKKNERCL